MKTGYNTRRDNLERLLEQRGAKASPDNQKFAALVTLAYQHAVENKGVDASHIASLVVLLK